MRQTDSQLALEYYQAATRGPVAYGATPETCGATLTWPGVEFGLRPLCVRVALKVLPRQMSGEGNVTGELLTDVGGAGGICSSLAPPRARQQVAGTEPHPPTLNNEWARPPRGGGHPFRDVSLSQYVCNFSRFVFWQFHDRITQVLGWALGVSVPHHPAAPSASSNKKAGKMGFVSHFPFAFGRSTRTSRNSSGP
jgi:hypothetical protein